MHRRTAILGFPALLSGCALSYSVPDGTVLAPNEGLLVVQVAGAQYGSLEFNPHGESTLGSKFAEMMLGPKGVLSFGLKEEFLVRPLEAGEYKWTKINTSGQYAWLRNSNRFKVAKSTITYIGSLRVSIIGSKFGIRVFDGEAAARQHLAEKYPKSLALLPFQKELADVRIGAS